MHAWSEASCGLYMPDRVRQKCRMHLDWQALQMTATRNTRCIQLQKLNIRANEHTQARTLPDWKSWTTKDSSA